MNPYLIITHVVMFIAGFVTHRLQTAQLIADVEKVIKDVEDLNNAIKNKQ